MGKKKQYKIGIWEETGGYITVQAATENGAQQKAETILDEEGVAGFSDFTSTGRTEYGLFLWEHGFRGQPTIMWFPPNAPLWDY
jgi:hypothetical protein